MKIDEKSIRKLATILQETDLNEIEIKEDDYKIRLSRGGASVIASAPMVAPAPVASASPAPAQNNVAAPAALAEDHPGAVKSPMVGTTYSKPEPSADPFISVGASVNKGDTLMIVEAMKVMNPIKAPQAGTIKDILVKDGQPVEYGEVLVVIE